MNFFIKSTACLFIENIFLTKEVYGRKRAYMYQCVRVSEADSADLLLSVCCDPPVLDTGPSASLPVVPAEDTRRLLLVRNSGKKSQGLRHFPELKFDSRHPPPKKIIRKSLKKHNIIGNHIRIDTDKYLKRKENRRKICTCLIAILF